MSAFLQAGRKGKAHWYFEELGRILKKWILKNVSFCWNNLFLWWQLAVLGVWVVLGTGLGTGLLNHHGRSLSIRGCLFSKGRPKHSLTCSLWHNLKDTTGPKTGVRVICHQKGLFFPYINIRKTSMPWLNFNHLGRYCKWGVNPSQCPGRDVNCGLKFFSDSTG